MGHMSNNAVLAYLDSFQPGDGGAEFQFFDRAFTGEHTLEALLSEIKNKVGHQANLSETAQFFAPYALRHPQLNQLLETLRCEIREAVKSWKDDDTSLKNFQEALNSAMVLTTVLEVVSRYCMSNPYTDEVNNFGGCDLIKLSSRQSLQNFADKRSS
jgi:hypothetical protein